MDWKNLFASKERKPLVVYDVRYHYSAESRRLGPIPPPSLPKDWSWVELTHKDANSKIEVYSAIEGQEDPDLDASGFQTEQSSFSTIPRHSPGLFSLKMMNTQSIDSGSFIMLDRTSSRGSFVNMQDINSLTSSPKVGPVDVTADVNVFLPPPIEEQETCTEAHKAPIEHSFFIGDDDDDEWLKYARLIGHMILGGYASYIVFRASMTLQKMVWHSLETLLWI